MLVIDTGLGPRNGQTVLREAAKVGKTSELYLVTTHYHPEHDLGASAFPASAKMIRSQDQIHDIEEFGLQIAKIVRQPHTVDGAAPRGRRFTVTPT